VTTRKGGTVQNFVAFRNIRWYGIDARGLSNAERALLHACGWTLGGRGSLAYGLYMTRDVRRWAALCRNARAPVRVDVLYNHKWREHYVKP
jgi:hypothetical protein